MNEWLKEITGQEWSGRPLTLALILLHTYTHIKTYSKINTKKLQN